MFFHDEISYRKYMIFFIVHTLTILHKMRLLNFRVFAANDYNNFLANQKHVLYTSNQLRAR